jgi:hypothetical protein
MGKKWFMVFCFWFFVCLKHFSHCNGGYNCKGREERKGNAKNCCKDQVMYPLRYFAIALRSLRFLPLFAN